MKPSIKRNKSIYKVQLPLTSLIDIVFLLLVYFLLTTNFMVDEGIKVKLPQANASKPQTEQEITVYVTKEGTVFLDNEMVPLNILFKRLKVRMAGNNEALVVVRADRDVVLNSAVKVMDVAKAAGAGKLCLATEKDFQP